MSKVFTITEGLENMGAIKTGGQGSVYKGRRVGEIITAIKLLPTPIFTQSEDDKHYRDFTNEVRKLQRVNEEPNPNIVKILSYGVSETGAFPFIEMEYIDGPDLGELLKPPHDPVFTIREVIKVAEHLSNALAHCHKLDVKHGDIKSNNVKFNKHTGNYVLLDFGLAILSDEERRTSLRQAGAIEFMAPEQNEGKMFFETDVYSFGIVLFELLAGKVPFPLDGNSETARNKVMIAHMEATPPDVLSLRASMLPTDWSDEKKALEMQVPEWLHSLIYKCLQKKPEDRFSNGQALHEFICHHRIYTAEVAGIVKSGDSKWKSLVAEKDYELQDLKAIVNRQDRELEALRQKEPVNSENVSEHKTVSRSAFNVVLLLLLLVGGLAAYGLFFHRSVVGSASTGTSDTLTSSDTLAANNQQAGIAMSENQSNAKQASKPQRKKQVTDTFAMQKNAEEETGESPAETDQQDNDSVKAIKRRKKTE
jgi:serine/threonine-protein kinase